MRLHIGGEIKGLTGIRFVIPQVDDPGFIKMGSDQRVDRIGIGRGDQQQPAPPFRTEIIDDLPVVSPVAVGIMIGKRFGGKTAGQVCLQLSVGAALAVQGDGIFRQIKGTDDKMFVSPQGFGNPRVGTVEDRIGFQTIARTDGRFIRLQQVQDLRIPAVEPLIVPVMVGLVEPAAIIFIAVRSKAGGAVQREEGTNPVIYPIAVLRTVKVRDAGVVDEVQVSFDTFQAVEGRGESGRLRRAGFIVLQFFNDPVLISLIRKVSLRDLGIAAAQGRIETAEQILPAGQNGCLRALHEGTDFLGKEKLISRGFFEVILKRAGEKRPGGKSGQPGQRAVFRFGNIFLPEKGNEPE